MKIASNDWLLLYYNKKLEQIRDGQSERKKKFVSPPYRS